MSFNADRDRRIFARYREHINPVYADFLRTYDLDRTIDHAEGSTLIDSRGKKYLDFVAGYGVFNLGHNPKSVVRALQSVFDTMPLWNRPFLSEPLVDFACELCSLAPEPLSQVLVCSSGAEAVDSAIKLARLVTRRKEIVSMESSFHGFTLGALSVSGIEREKMFFRPLLPEVRHAAFGDLAALSCLISETTAAVIVEPIQAEAGAVQPPPGTLRGIRTLCDQTGALMIVDEIRTGIGRTGSFCALEQEAICPDVLLLGKSLAAGIVPIGALLTRKEFGTKMGLSFAMTASSFSGNRLSCIAGLESLKLWKRGLSKAVSEMIPCMSKQTEQLFDNHKESISHITGGGMLAGLHFFNVQAVPKIIHACIQHGLLVSAAFCNKKCILLEPPLVLTPSELESGFEILDQAIKKTGCRQ